MRITIDPSRVAQTFSRFSDNPSLQESAQLFARGLPIAEMIQAFAMNENVLRAFAGFESIYPYGTIERSILEKVILRVSQLHECQFCTNSHLEIMQGLGTRGDARAGVCLRRRTGGRCPIASRGWPPDQRSAPAGPGSGEPGRSSP